MNFKPFKIGKYLLLERLATGGMAEVYRAKASGAGGFEKQLAIKRIIPNYSENEEFRRMFEYEARLSSLLNHANIVHVYDFVKSGDTYLLAMEFVDGKNLRQVVNKAKRMGVDIPIGFSVFVINEVCKGLDYAHKMRDGYQGKHLNVIHRDMSPQNIMLGYEGAIKIVDFGIAKARDRVDETRSGVIKGKFGYMSPEQASGEEIDHRSDIFSTVIILYELVTGKRLFAADNDMATLKRIQECIVQRPSLVNPKINSTLEKILLKGLTKDRNLRYQQAGELHQKLQEYLNKFHPTITQNSISAMMSNLFTQEIRQEKKRLAKVYQESIPYSQGEMKQQEEDFNEINNLLDGEMTKSEENPDSLITKVSEPEIELESSAPKSKTTPPVVAEPPSVTEEEVQAELAKNSPETSPKKEISEISISEQTSKSDEKTAFAPSIGDELFTKSVNLEEDKDTLPERSKKLNSITTPQKEIKIDVPEEKPIEKELPPPKPQPNSKETSIPPVSQDSSFGPGSKSFTLVTEAKKIKSKEPDSKINKEEITLSQKFTIEPGSSYHASDKSDSLKKKKPKLKAKLPLKKKAPPRKEPLKRPIPPRGSGLGKRIEPHSLSSRWIRTGVLLFAMVGTLVYYLTSGDPEVEVASNQAPRSTTNVAPTKTPKPKATPRGESCATRLDSDPRGATALVNGKSIGRTPVVAFIRCNKQARIEYRLNGYRTHKNRIKVSKKTGTYYKTLKRVPQGQVQVILSHNAILYVNGAKQKVRIRAGRPFTIALEANKYHWLRFENPTLKLKRQRRYRLKPNQLYRDRVSLKSTTKRRPTTRKRTPTRRPKSIKSPRREPKTTKKKPAPKRRTPIKKKTK